jgi:hypothetical protein
MLKMDKISIEENLIHVPEAEVPETLEGITKEVPTVTVISMLEQVENRSLAESMKPPVIGTSISTAKLPRSQTIS